MLCHPPLDFCQVFSTDSPCVKQQQIQLANKAVLATIKNEETRPNSSNFFVRSRKQMNLMMNNSVSET